MALPDSIEIVPLDQPVRAEITVPGSKSITNRALILAALAEGEVTLEGALWSEDTQIMVECLQELGFMVNVQPDPDEVCNRTITVYGRGGEVPPGGTEQQPLELFVGNAGTAARFLAAFVCLGRGVYRLHGVPRMHERPQAALFQALRELGYRVESEKDNDKLPARIFGGSDADRGSVSRSQYEAQPATVEETHPSQGAAAAGHRPALPSRHCTVSIVESSQFASALLLCAKPGGWQIDVTGENAEESPYVAMTLKLKEAFPTRGGKFRIEPDASSGSYFLAAGKIAAQRESLEYSEQFQTDVPTTVFSSVKVADWPASEWQVDEKFQEFLWFGPFPHNVAELMQKHSSSGPERFREIRKELERRERDGISRKDDLGDSIMAAVVLAAAGRAQTLGLSTCLRFVDLARLRLQECDRVFALRSELTRCGAKVVEEGDTLTVYPSDELHGAEIETYNDHRMAMCFAILGLRVPGIKIKNPACVKKTFPNFFQKLAAPPPKGLGAVIRDARTGRALAQDELFAE